MHKENSAEKGYCLCCGNMGAKKINANRKKDEGQKEIRMMFEIVEALENTSQKKRSVEDKKSEDCFIQALKERLNVLEGKQSKNPMEKAWGG